MKSKYNLFFFHFISNISISLKRIVIYDETKATEK